MDAAERIRAAVLAALPEHHRQPELRRFRSLLRAYPERSGKTLRGRFVLLSAAAHSGDGAAALTTAAALELFQNWVLVHDDIEDDSEERRGAPALHRQVGVPVALNVGDAMHVYMWQLLLSLPAAPARPGGVDREAVLREFLWMIQRTAEGQHLDLSWVAQGRFDISEEDYLTMVTLKTAYYTVVCPLRLGAACGSAAADPGVEPAGVDLGVAFQIRDDVLNLLPDVAYGKEFAGDLYEGKRTLILAHLFAHATADERAEVEDVLAAPRADKRPADIERVLALIERHGSLGYAHGAAELRARRGLAGLEGALEGAADADAARDLLELMASLARRRT